VLTVMVKVKLFPVEKYTIDANQSFGMTVNTIITSKLTGQT
jgi:hypothetical protein